MLRSHDVHTILAFVYTGIDSSTHVNYGEQAEEWKGIATRFGATLEELATFLADKTSEGFPGVEGLYELTRNQKLFELTDYADTTTDALAVSYFYSSPERIKHWERCLDVTPDTLMRSVYNALTERGSSPGTVEGATVKFEDLDDNAWGSEEILLGLLRQGWNIQETVKESNGRTFKTWTCLGRDKPKGPRMAVSRLLDK